MRVGGGPQGGRIVSLAMRIGHIRLARPQGREEEARRYFAELLGMDEVEKPESLRYRLEFQDGDAQPDSDTAAEA